MTNLILDRCLIIELDRLGQEGCTNSTLPIYVENVDGKKLIESPFMMTREIEMDVHKSPRWSSSAEMVSGRMTYTLENHFEQNEGPVTISPRPIHQVRPLRTKEGSKRVYHHDQLMTLEGDCFQYR